MDKTYYNMLKRIFTLTFSVAILVCANAQGPHNTGTYYQNANGKKGAALKTALSGIISSHKTIPYSNLNDYYPKTDARADGKLWDMYSNITNYSFSSTGGNSKEGAGWNKEHSIPQSWFGEASPMKSDIMHVIPTDAYVNGMRSNDPFGETDNPKKISANGFSKQGTCSVEGYSGTCFEPNDEYKGDFARIYFYMATCYENRMSLFTQSNGKYCFDGNQYPSFKPWFLNMLLRWAKNDPVSQKEIDRNKAVYDCQGNRNPFVDYPELEQYIWGDCQDRAFSYDKYVGPEPILLPETPYAIAATNITATSFTANWEYADYSDSYTIELRKTQQGASEDMTVMTETFAKCEGDGNTENNDCDKYMDNIGWTSAGIYPTGGRIKLASAKKSSALTSPLLTNPSGHVIVKFTEQVYNNDATTITISIVNSDGQEIAKQEVSAEGKITTHTIAFNNIDTDYKISFTTGKGERYYLSYIEIIAGGGAQTIIEETKDIHNLSYTFTSLSPDYQYSYRVKGVNKDGESDWSNRIDVDSTLKIISISQSAQDDRTPLYNIAGQKMTHKKGIGIRKGKKYLIHNP